MPRYDKHAAYRRRQKAKGNKDVLMRLPAETVARIDDLKAARGFDSRSEAALALILKGLEGFTHQEQAA